MDILVSYGLICFIFLTLFETAFLYESLLPTKEDYNNIPQPDSTLKYVIATYRHGTRAPLYFPYRNDPYKPQSKYFPEGKGRLTKAGKQLMYNVGVALRARYGTFIGDGGTFDAKKVRFTSTEGSRNKLSALLVTEGMYNRDSDYPDFSQEYNIDKHHIPISFNTNNFDKSFLVSKFPLHAFDCKYFSQQFVYNIIAGLIIPHSKENTELISYLSKQTGTSFKSIVSYLNIWDRLECQRLNGFPLPDWTKKVYPDKMRRLALNNVQQTIAGTDLMNSLGSALFFKELHGLFDLAKSGSQRENMYLHATHENALYQVLFKLKIQHPTKVEVGDVILFELHEIGGDYHIKTFYYKPYYNTLHELEIPGCEESCHIDKFRELTPEMSMSQWKKICKTKATSYTSFMETVNRSYKFTGELTKWIYYSRS